MQVVVFSKRFRCVWCWLLASQTWSCLYVSIFVFADESERRSEKKNALALVAAAANAACCFK